MKTIIILLLSCLLWSNLNAQTFYVDAVKGKPDGKGTINDPFKDLGDAIKGSSNLNNKESITIKLFPGLYILSGPNKIESKDINNSTSFTVEALIMPDDTSWKPSSMPVIHSVSANNVKTYFEHCAGFEVLRNNVFFKGLKFTGNANPNVENYYPIERDSANLKTVGVSQCLFVGEPNSGPIQGAIYMEGANGVQVDHCIFYNCKNALLLFYSAKNFSLTNSIIYGAYESAIWFGVKNEKDSPFYFRNNIISDCEFFWLNSRNEDHPSFRFAKSLITNNRYYMGVYDVPKGPAPYRRQGSHKEENILKTGKVILNKATARGIPWNYLQPSAQSAGNELNAGLFKVTKPVSK